MRLAALTVALLLIAVPASATFSGSGGKTIYTKRTSGTSFELRSINGKGKTAKVISDFGQTAANYPGQFSPNGKRVTYFQHVSAGDNEIWTAKADGSDQKQLTSNTTDDLFPSYSPDGSMISFSRNGDLYVMNADGTDQHLVKTGLGTFDSRWTPNGNRIIFTQYDSSAYEVNSITPAGTGFVQLSPDGPYSFLGDVSPDGKYILFFDQGVSDYSAYRMDIDGSHVKPFGPAGYVTYPIYNAAGTKFFYNLTTPDGVQIWSARASDGKHRQKVLANGTDNYLGVLP